ncbi:putative duf207 domain-containing protein [Erysiphe neolycopersici]|uniref:tRNA(Phe) 7-[(3-amino-3-carboxypropyl)-4-demethylwyosine(37)-N(4)]-methyltransferase n=1 Tax=Erysiphe neolycopersici TaxID=212602 RepID=A0A420HSG6_9PEZI|nr:putative duf207 domain-containing protein [Erysiphe neolycopersici]
MAVSHIPISFQRKKAHILASLSVPEEEYNDLSPKGTVDKGIRQLIHDINQIPGCVTTSSCAGRISIFLEGRKKEHISCPELLIDDNRIGGKDTLRELDISNNDHDDIMKFQGKEFDPSSAHVSNSVGGKGGGGRWLFVSHDPIKLPTSKLFSRPHDDCHRYDENSVVSNNGEDEKQEEQKSCIELLGMQELQTLIMDEKDLKKNTNEEVTGVIRGAENLVINENQDAHITPNIVTSRAMIDVSKLFSQPNLTSTIRMIHFKFEPMILHILTASLAQANRILVAAIQAGFRESGAINLLELNRKKLYTKQRHHNINETNVSEKKISAQENAYPNMELESEVTPMVAIRSNGLALESIVGLELNGRHICMIPEWQMRGIVLQANQRFIDNTQRITRFAKLLLEKEDEQQEGSMSKSHYNKKATSVTSNWEDPVARRARKRQEGLDKARIKAESLRLNKP